MHCFEHTRWDISSPCKGPGHIEYNGCVGKVICEDRHYITVQHLLHQIFLGEKASDSACFSGMKGPKLWIVADSCPMPVTRAPWSRGWLPRRRSPARPAGRSSCSNARDQTAPGLQHKIDVKNMLKGTAPQDKDAPIRGVVSSCHDYWVSSYRRQRSLPPSRNPEIYRYILPTASSLKCFARNMLTVLRETLTQYITFNRGGRGWSVLLYFVVLQL